MEAAEETPPTALFKAIRHLARVAILDALRGETVIFHIKALIAHCQAGGLQHRILFIKAARGSA